LQISAGEMEETRYFLLLACDLGYVRSSDFDRASVLCDSVGQLINALARSLKSRADSASVSRVTNHGI